MALNAKMKRAAEILVSEPEKKLGDIAKELKIDESTLWRYRQRDDFKEYEHQLCVERMVDLQKLAIEKLKDNARNGNQKAIEYILNYGGFKAKEQIEVTENCINIHIDE